MKFFIFFLITSYSALLIARPKSAVSEHENEIVTRQGKMFTLQITKGEPLRIYVLDREAARVDLKNLKIKVRRLNPYPPEDLQTNFEMDHFTISKVKKSQPLKEIEITTTVQEKQETFNIILSKP